MGQEELNHLVNNILLMKINHLKKKKISCSPLSYIVLLHYLMEKLIFYEKTSKHEIGDIIYGYIDLVENKKNIPNDYGDIISYPMCYPVMKISEWRQNQINDIIL